MSGGITFDYYLELQERLANRIAEARERLLKFICSNFRDFDGNDPESWIKKHNAHLVRVQFPVGRKILSEKFEFPKDIEEVWVDGQKVGSFSWGFESNALNISIELSSEQMEKFTRWNQQQKLTN